MTPEMEKAARSGNLNGPDTLDQRIGQANSSRLNPDTKRAAVLRVFLKRGERGLNCFEAVALAHDYVLRTTVSECVRYHGITFAKHFEAVPGFAGSRVDCVRYALTAEGAARVRELLGESLEAVCA